MYDDVNEAFWLKSTLNAFLSGVKEGGAEEYDALRAELAKQARIYKGCNGEGGLKGQLFHKIYTEKVTSLNSLSPLLNRAASEQTALSPSQTLLPPSLPPSLSLLPPLTSLPSSSNPHRLPSFTYSSHSIASSPPISF